MHYHWQYGAALSWTSRAPERSWGPETLSDLCRKHGVERPMDTSPSSIQHLADPGSLETSPRYSDLALEFDSAAILFHYAQILPTIPHFTTCSLFGTFHSLLHTILIHWSINCEGKGGMRLAVLSCSIPKLVTQGVARASLTSLRFLAHPEDPGEQTPKICAALCCADENYGQQSFCGIAPHAPK